MSRSVKANALRERHLAVLKKTIDTVQTLTGDACPSTIAVYKNELETSYASYYEAFTEHEDSIIGKDGQETVLEEISTEYREIHAKYLTAKIKIGKLTAAANPNTTLNSSMSESSFNAEQPKTCKLPPIRLTSFTGEMKDWMEFKATCRSILTDKIHDVQRLQYLKDALQDEPRELVKHILPADGAYEKAMFLLKKRYENTRAIVNDQLRRLYTIQPNDPSCEKVSTLRTVVNTINSLKASLDGCEIDTSTWDTILTFNTSQCLHADSRKAWEEKLEGTRSVPSLAQYLEFLETRIIILETTQTFSVPPGQSRPKPLTKTNTPAHYQNRDRAKVFFTIRSDYKCTICQRNHLSSRCDEIARMSSQDRKAAVQKANVCFNCLQPFHLCAQCPFEPACKKCTGKHHTLLHEDKHKVMVTQATSDDSMQMLDDEQDALSMVCTENFYHIRDGNVTILATAMVPVRWNGRSIILKALIDQGSTANLITERACNLLNLPYTMDHTQMTGLGNTFVGRGVGKTTCSIGSIHDRTYDFDTKTLVVKRIAEIAPSRSATMQEWKHLSGLKLADPRFLDAHKIDLLLGAAVYAELVLGDVVKGQPGEPIAQLTKLGYIVFGPAQVNKEFTELCNTLQDNQLDESEDSLISLIKTFWEVEEVEMPQQCTNDEAAAEQAFVQSVKRAPDGKFIVDLPFRVNPNSIECLGESRIQAEKRLFASQRRFKKNPSIKVSYDLNLNEYLTLGHMKELESHEIARCFLPHHPVIKESSSTTKVRTVFDASAKTTNGRSLNDILFVGPTIQPDLFDLLIQWRRYRYAISGDIEKMYRQIWINPEHALFQCVLWQPPDSDAPKPYKLLTVTFGTGSAPFQAIRSLDEVGRRMEKENPSLAEQIRKHFYVDDYLGTANDIEAAIMQRTQITEELAKYGFNLRKWKSNDERILQNVQKTEKEEIISFDTTFKTLGIEWQPSTDAFQFKSSTPKSFEQWTKRKILSEIARLFDPLGWLAPCVVKAKMLMQSIWRLSNKFDWDTPVPTHIATKWQRMYAQLCLPIPIQVPRWIGLTNDTNHIEIHGFCDASVWAFAACVYLKVQYSDEHIVCNLVAAKTKLAPIKTVTIPRLELCGAMLLTKLLCRCVKTLALTDGSVHAWSDSMITLSWLAGCPSRWSVFVSNRVSAIQKSIPLQHWKHVPTKQNPADIASRGTLVQELANAELWWHGPSFLKTSESYPEQPAAIGEQDIPEQKLNTQIFHLATQTENYVLERFSQYNRLLRFTMYAMRWRNRTPNRVGVIRAHEIVSVEKLWIRIVQSEMFGKELNDISHDKWANVPVIRQLNPFIDEHGILRMNGRVGNADILEQKTAIILPPKHYLTLLIIRDAHEQVLHGGVQLTLRKLREKFWIIHARQQVQRLIHQCVTCFRYRKQFMQQKMAELPNFRTEQARPFAFVGCDYAGFFEIKVSNRRNAPTSKGYIALFICLTTKALHLELVSDLSTAEFIMAFENFIARKGIPTLLYTDNGTNFIGGAKEITRFYEQIFSQNNAFTNLLALKNIEFKTIPARASHMAGIWERAVGSVKYHLRRTLKDTKLNARQFDHVLKQIEACLNSRPLWAVTPEIDDIEVLTPSHFSNFRAINTLPRPDISHIPLNRLDQYQYLYRLYCNFWKAWSAEYLHQLQPRPKWQKEHPNAVIGQIVLISDDNLPPSRWLHGKITAVYPARDGLIRTVDVQCGKSTLRRPIHRLALLPIPDNNQLELLAQGGENVVAPSK